MPFSTPRRLEASRLISSPARVILNAVCLIFSATSMRFCGVGELGEGRSHDARTRNAHVNDGVRLSAAVDRAGHEGGVLHHVGKNDQLSGTVALNVGGATSGFEHGFLP